MEKLQFNEHGKKEYEPMHTVEHLINGTMVRLFGTGRSLSAHIEKKKSRMDFRVDFVPTDEDAKALEAEVNRILREDLPVTFKVVPQSEANQYGVDLSRIPEDASEMVRIAMIGSYDTCLCIGDHVDSTGECGQVEIYSHDYDAERQRWRVRFKLEGASDKY